MTLRVAIIGLGQIGMGYDMALPPDAFVLTHARAFQQHPAFELLCGVDADGSRQSDFTSTFQRPAFSSIADTPDSLRPDVVVIAVPTSAHAVVVSAVLAKWPLRAILCEKPLSFEMEEARQMVAMCAEKHCELYVNYIRRSDPGVQEIKARLLDQRIKAPVKGVVWYSKGLFNNGSHFFNLLQYWLGEVRSFKIIQAGRWWAADDPEPDFVVSFEQGEAYFLAAKEEDFSHYTVELVSPTGRLRYEQGGERIIWQAISTSDTGSAYQTLQPAEQIVPTGLDRYQWHVADQLHRSLNKLAAHLCTGAEALGTIEYLTEIKNAL